MRFHLARRDAGLDLHIAAVLLFVLPLGFVVAPRWMGVVCAALPQGRILTQARDRSKAGRPVLPYVAVNESMILAVTALYLLLWRA